jgi:SAM-dependent methyltransferase
VLAFYKELPFNYRMSPAAQAREIRRNNAIAAGYPVLQTLLGKRTSLLDLGCGAGWFALNAAYHYGCDTVGVDFNDVAIARTRTVADALGVAIVARTADLFLFEPDRPFDLVASIGVLHHTNDCHAALRRVCTALVRPGGHVFISLYHRHGRRPFLDHFARLRDQGASEDQLLAEYRRLHPHPDEIYLRSWFRDQVLHPHETQHTLAELMPILDDCGMTVVATTINQFAAFRNIGEVLAQEESLEQRGIERLREGRYFPGVFVFLARKA